MERNKRTKQFIPEFDSSSSMLFSLGNHLFGRSEAVGIPPKLPNLLGDIINLTPKALRRSAYKVSGVQEALSQKQLSAIEEEDITEWVADAYPPQKYPAVMIGSSSGGLIHLCSMAGIPWVPQTVLLAIRRTMDPDELMEDMEWGREPVSKLKKKLPGFRFYQMHDPVQDRVMITNMGYFRVKRIRLGASMKDYLSNTLVPGGTILVSDCRYKWPSHKVDDLHYFQTGGLGDVSGGEYAGGSSRIKSFLEQEGSKYEKWHVPRPLTDVPEGEWGFDGELEGDIRDFAGDNGFKVKRLIYDHPASLSPLAADMTRRWYADNGIESNRYLIECFALLEPYMAARTGSIPYWMPFNTRSSLDNLEGYLKEQKKADEMYVMIMSNAVKGIGFVPVPAWKKVMNRYSRENALIGIDEKQYPYDLGSFIKYYKDLHKTIDARYYLPAAMPFEEFTGLLRKKGGKYNVKLKRANIKRN